MASEDWPVRPTRRECLTGLTGVIAALAGCTTADPDGPTVGNSAPPEQDTRSTEHTTTTTTGTTRSTSPGTQLHASYDTTEVRVLSPEGDLLGSVTAAIADTADLRYTGLSDTESLPEDRGMLFVYQEVGEHAYVMRDMDFGLDIVFADDDGVINQIYHAPPPSETGGSEGVYEGVGQYVLEVNRGWTTERDVTAGDRLAFELPSE